MSSDEIEVPKRGRDARVAVSRTVTMGTVESDGLRLREWRMVDVGLGGCAISGEVVPQGTHVTVLVDDQLVLVGRALPPRPGDRTTRLEWVPDQVDAAELVSRFGIDLGD